jgi:hypothetical protein
MQNQLDQSTGLIDIRHRGVRSVLDAGDAVWSGGGPQILDLAKDDVVTGADPASVSESQRFGTHLARLGTVLLGQTVDHVALGVRGVHEHDATGVVGPPLGHHPCL